MKYKYFLRTILLLIYSLIYTSGISSQEFSQINFRDKPVRDILFALADLGKMSVICDETVTGNTSFFFSTIQYETALNSFLTANNLYRTTIENVHYISKIYIEASTDPGKWTTRAQDISTELFLKTLSRRVGITIVFDPLPNSSINIHAESLPLPKIIEIAMNRFPEYRIIDNGHYFYIKKEPLLTGSSQRSQGPYFQKGPDTYTIQAAKVRFLDILDELMTLENKEYSLMMRGEQIIDRLAFSDRPFEQTLRLVLEQVNCDYTIKDDIYYFFDIQRRDIIKKLKDTISIPLSYIQAQDAINLLPQDLSSASFIRINKTSNTLYLTGSEEEIKPVYDFIVNLDRQDTNRKPYIYISKYFKAKELIPLIPSIYTNIPPMILPDEYSFIIQLTENAHNDFLRHMTILDSKQEPIPIELKYLKASELIKNPPPSVSKSELLETGSEHLLFYTGAVGKLSQVRQELERMDIPRPQIRYDILVAQFERNNNLNLSSKANASRHVSSEGSNTATGAAFPNNDAWSLAGQLGNLLNIKFDILSTLGYVAALEFQAESSRSISNVFADTSLVALSGQEVKFQSTSTVHYLESKINTDGTVTTTGSAQSLSYGLLFNINGWISGDEMITMNITATISRKADTSTNSETTLPPTTERVVSTQLRSRAGQPISITGLLQKEKSVTESRVPILGSIPLLGLLFREKKESEALTEINIYIIPHIIDTGTRQYNINNQMERYYRKYMRQPITINQSLP